MKKFKRVVATVMALGMVSTMGVSTLVNADEVQKTFYTGDVNLDGKVNTVDLLTLKKMLLGIIDMQEMYIDDDTLKLVEDTTTNEVDVIRATEYTVDVENSTIDVTEKDFQEVLLDEAFTLKVTDDTVFNGQFSSLEELSEELQDGNIYVAITYDVVTKEITEINQFSVINTSESSFVDGTEYQYWGYVVDLEESRIRVQVDTVLDVQPVYLELMVTDDTIFNSTAKNLEELANDDSDYIITFDFKTQEVLTIEDVIVTSQQDFATMSVYYGGDTEIDEINSDENFIRVCGKETDWYQELYVNDSTTYTGLVSSFSDLSEYQSCYLLVMTTDYECYEFTYNWYITYHYDTTTEKYIIDSIDVSKC